MGVGGAAKLITSADDNPQANAARMFPNAAAANRSIFYDRNGNARSVSEVYSVLSARYAGAANSPVTQTALAMYGAGPSNVSAVASGAPTPAVDNSVYLSTFPNVHAATPAAASTSDTSGNSQPNDPIFRSLFQADGGTQTVSPAVRALWGNSASLTADTGSSANRASAPAPLDLFSDPSGTFSG